MDSLTDYQGSRIRKLYYEMSAMFQDIHFKGQYAEENNMALLMEIDALEDNFFETGKLLYNICLAYFETQNLSNYLQRFERNMESVIQNRKKMLDNGYQDDAYSIFLGQIWEYMHPFPVFHNNDEELLSRIGLLYLEHILASTGVIIRDLGKVPKTETEVYNSVKIVSKATFKSAQFPTEAFVKTAKCYKPDILIPSLNCAVEYKYATDEKELNKTMDEILIDVVGYAHNRVYKVFYAVFYVAPATCTQDRFKVLWDEKEFPDNWKGILVEGI